METQALKEKMDKIGVAVSLGCLVHCVVLPLFVTSLSLAGLEIMSNLWIEILMIVIAASAGSYAIFQGYKIHKQKTVLFLFVSGILFLITGNTHLAGLPEAMFKGSGAFLLITAHIINFRLGRCGIKL